MNQKVVKLKEEREKNCEKIALLQSRNKKIDADILSIENTDIIYMVRESNLTPDILAELIAAMKKTQMPVPFGKSDEAEEPHEEI